MKVSALSALACSLAIVALAACGGHSSPMLPASNPGGSNLSGTASFDWGKEAMSGAAYAGPANAGHMQVSVLVNQQNAQGLLQYAQQAADPASASYRRFLTPDEIAARFGATLQDYRKTANYFVANGLTVGGWRQRLSLTVAGPQQAMEKAFGTKFGLYTKDGAEFVAPVTTPHFAAALPVTAVSNLVAERTMHTYAVPVPPRANANDTLGYSPQQLRTAFDYSGAYTAGFSGNGITIGIIGTGPINVTRSGPGALCNDADLAALKALYATSSAPVCERDVTTSGVAAGLAASGIPTASPTWSPVPNATPSPNPGVSPPSLFPFSGSFQTPPPVSQNTCTGALPACNPEDLEAQLDVEQAAMLATGATVTFYLAYNAADCAVIFPDSCTTSGSNAATAYLGITEGDAEIQQAIADNTADVISISYGGGEPQQAGSGLGSAFDSRGRGYAPVEFAELAAEGIAVFVSSGDSGSAECLGGTNGYLPQPCVSYPSGDVNVTSVGGVNAPINEFGQLNANLTAWGVTNGGLSQTDHSSASGSGGGTSTIFSAPPWQYSAIGATMREQPDVSLVGDTLTGVTVYTNGTCSNCGGSPGATAVGGTSVATPEMAAMWALVLDACNQSASCKSGGSGAKPYRLGNAAPYFYSIYKGSSAAGTGHIGFSPFLSYVNTFYDVVYGNNAMPGTATPVPGVNAGPGYDEVTGLGVPFARHLVKAVTNR
ncbi:MAG: protease pro-enzyme activation domain-containing protein [Candidatus Baltobacteraceae bacterium]